MINQTDPYRRLLREQSGISGFRREQKARIPVKVLLSPRLAPKITNARCNRAEIKALCVRRPSFLSFLAAPGVSFSVLLSPRNKKEFLPRFSRRVDLGHTLLFTCRRLASAETLSNPRSHPPSFVVLILAKCCDRHPACSFFALLTPARSPVPPVKGAFRPVQRGYV